MNRRTLLTFALLAFGALLVAGWVMWSGRVAANVTITWSPQSPACEGTTVKRAGSERPVIEATETMRCVITVEVTNRGRRTVHIAHAVAPMVGPRTGAVVTAQNAQRLAKGGKYDFDALFPIDRELRAGKSTAFDIVLVLHPRGCNDSGTLWSSRWPIVTVDALGRSHDLRGNKDFAFHRDGATPGCRHLDG